MKKIIVKAIYALFRGCIEARRAEWKRHCVQIQNELNKEHYERLGWYVSAPDHRLIVKKRGTVIW